MHWSATTLHATAPAPRAIETQTNHPSRIPIRIDASRTHRAQSIGVSPRARQPQPSREAPCCERVHTRRTRTPGQSPSRAIERRITHEIPRIVRAAHEHRASTASIDDVILAAPCPATHPSIHPRAHRARVALHATARRAVARVTRTHRIAINAYRAYLVFAYIVVATCVVEKCREEPSRAHRFSRERRPRGPLLAVG